MNLLLSYEPHPDWLLRPLYEQLIKETGFLNREITYLTFTKNYSFFSLLFFSIYDFIFPKHWLNEKFKFCEILNTVLYKRRKIEKYRNDLRGLSFRDIAITNLHQHQHVHHDTPCYTVILCRRLQMHVFHCPLHTLN